MNSLIDGLIVEDQDHDTRVARYLAFDVIIWKARRFGRKNWKSDCNAYRMRSLCRAKMYVWYSSPRVWKEAKWLYSAIMPCCVVFVQDKSFGYTQEPFRVRMKDHFRLAKTEYMLTKFAKSVTHEVDGVIYTPTEASYNLGGFECEEPIFKFVACEGGGIPGLDGSIS